MEMRRGMNYALHISTLEAEQEKLQTTTKPCLASVFPGYFMHVSGRVHTVTHVQISLAGIAPVLSTHSLPDLSLNPLLKTP